MKEHTLVSLKSATTVRGERVMSDQYMAFQQALNDILRNNYYEGNAFRVPDTGSTNQSLELAAKARETVQSPNPTRRDNEGFAVAVLPVIIFACDGPALSNLSDNFLKARGITSSANPSKRDSILKDDLGHDKKLTTNVDCISSLSKREKEILQLAALGESNKEIAHKCSVSEATVKTHFRNIFSKIDVSNRTAAVVHASSEGLLNMNQIADTYSHIK